MIFAGIIERNHAKECNTNYHSVHVNRHKHALTQIHINTHTDAHARTLYSII